MAVSDRMQSPMKPASASRGVVSPVVVVILIIGIIAVLIVIGMFAMGEVVGQSYDNVDVTVRVSGNDVVVTVIGGDDVPYVTGIRAYIDGTPRTSLPEFHTYVALGTEIVFPELARGVAGSTFVIVEAAFDDDTIGVINYARLQFN